MLVGRRPAVVAACLLSGLLGGLAIAASRWNSAAPEHIGEYSGWVTDRRRPGAVRKRPARHGRDRRRALRRLGLRLAAAAAGRSPGGRGRVRRGRTAHDDLATCGGRRSATSSAASRSPSWAIGTTAHRCTARRRVCAPRCAASPNRRWAPPTRRCSPAWSSATTPASRRRWSTAFRASGLSHLTAVSGQNVAFVLAAASPLLRRLRPWWRWAATRRLDRLVHGAHPLRAVGAARRGDGDAGGRRSCSVVSDRPAAPAGAGRHRRWCSSTRCWCGRSASGCRSAPPPACASSARGWPTACPGRGGCALPLSVTLGAQLGVAVPSLLVFHRLPLVSLPANLLAVPVAGFVMLYGLPAGLLVGAACHRWRRLVMAPCAVGTRWVATVAYLGGRLEPSPRWAAVGWLAIVRRCRACAGRSASLAAPGRRCANLIRHGCPPHHRRRRVAAARRASATSCTGWSATATGR